ncbi:MAG: calcium-binding protein, partial [Pseudomonadota bacterium]
KSGAHGDVIQPLGPIGDIKMYNFTGSTTYQGLFFSNQPSRSGAHIQGIDLENVNLKYNGGSKSYALWFDHGQDVKLKNVFVEERSGYSAQSWSVWPKGAKRSGNELDLSKFGYEGKIKVGNPPGGDYAKASEVGAGYKQGTVTKTEYKEVITTKTVVVDPGSEGAIDPSAGSDNQLKFIQSGANTIVYVDENGNGNYTKLIELKNVNATELAAAYNSDDGNIPTDNPPSTETPAEDPTDQPDPPPAEDPPAEGPPAEDPPAEDPPATDQPADNRPDVQAIPDIEQLDPDNWIRGTDHKGDWLTGTSRDDYINGRGKNDTMTGKRGDDTYNVSNHGDKIIEKAGEGTDTVVSWSLRFTLADNVEHARLKRDEGKLDGNELDNIVLGSRGDNVIDTKDGDDIIIGARGDDTLTGGDGSDIFVYQSDRDGKDIITDFTIGEDVIDLRELNIDLSDLEIKNSAGDAVIYVNNQQLATLEQVTAEQLSANDDFWF